jgi:hypothetical protein
LASISIDLAIDLATNARVAGKTRTRTQKQRHGHGTTGRRGRNDGTTGQRGKSPGNMPLRTPAVPSSRQLCPVVPSARQIGPVVPSSRQVPWDLPRCPVVPSFLPRRPVVPCPCRCFCVRVRVFPATRAFVAKSIAKSMLIDAKRLPVASRCFPLLPVASRCVFRRFPLFSLFLRVRPPLPLGLACLRFPWVSSVFACSRRPVAPSSRRPVPVNRW